MGIIYVLRLDFCPHCGTTAQCVRSAIEHEVTMGHHHKLDHPSCPTDQRYPHVVHLNTTSLSVSLQSEPFTTNKSFPCGPFF
jgi:hypothetical protein